MNQNYLEAERGRQEGLLIIRKLEKRVKELEDELENAEYEAMEQMEQMESNDE